VCEKGKILPCEVNVEMIKAKKTLNQKLMFVEILRRRRETLFAKNEGENCLRVKMILI
jgi:hypothetical protein